VPVVSPFRLSAFLLLAAGLALPAHAAPFASASGWRAVGRSPQAEADGEGNAALPCSFAPSGLFRRPAPSKISWKREEAGDWRNASGFAFTCALDPPGEGVELELRLLSPSGGDWRARRTFRPASSAPETLRFPRADFRPVGDAGAFGEIAGVQLCVSPFPAREKRLWFRRFWPVKEDCVLRPLAWEALADERLCVLRLPGGERGADDLSESLFLAGFSHVVRPADEAADALARAETAVVFFPAAPGRELTRTLQDFLARGGRLGAFYEPGASLASSMGFRAGRFRRVPGGGSWRGMAFAGGGEVLAPCNHWIDGETASPDARVAARWLDGEGEGPPAVLAGPHGFWVTAAPSRLDARGAEDALAALLAETSPRLAKTAEELAARRAAETAAAEALVRDGAQRFARAPGEVRGIWATGPLPPPSDWEATARRLRAAGFDRVYLRSLKGLDAAWDSDVLHPGEGLEEALDACERAGIELHAWFVLFDLAGASRAVRDGLEKAGRLAENAEGAALPWLSPHHPENQSLLRRAVGELVTRHPRLAGVQVDYLREPDGGDWSPAAREACARATGRAVPTRADVLPGGDAAAAFRRWRAADLTAFLASLRAAAKAANPACTVSAAVYPAAGAGGGAIAQDWRGWLQAGLLDEAVPMNYTENAAELAGWLAAEPLAGGRVLSGLALSAAGVHPAAAETLEQMALSREAGAKGVVLFALSEAEGKRLFPLLEEAERRANEKENPR